MVAVSALQSLKLYVAGLGGHAAGNEESLVTNVRSRFNRKYLNMDRPGILAKAYVFSCEPIVRYLEASLSTGQLKGFGRTALGLHVYEIYKIAVQRTRIGKKFAGVTDDDEQWASVEASLMGLVLGHIAEAPKCDGDEVYTRDWKPPLASRRPWWSGRRCVSVFFLLLGLLVFQVRYILSIGRSRFYVTMLSIVLTVISVVYWIFGPTHLPSLMLAAAETVQEFYQEDDGAESEASTASAASTAPPWPLPAESPSVQPDPAVSQLTAEMAELKQMISSLGASPARPSGVPDPAASSAAPAAPTLPSVGYDSAPMSALMSFANNIVPEGPISQTGLRQVSLQQAIPPGAAPSRLQAGAPAFMPASGTGAAPSAAPVQSGQLGWNLAASGERAARQARLLLQSYNNWEGRRATNPHWGINFYQDVARVEAEQSLEQDLLRVLRSYGYLGPSSMGAPRYGLREELQAIIDRGAPPLGTGYAVPAAGAQAPFGVGEPEVRWESQLPPELQRGAAEIYRSIRAGGVANMREWLNTEYPGSRDAMNHEWVSLWDVHRDRLRRCQRALL